METHGYNYGYADCGSIQKTFPTFLKFLPIGAAAQTDLESPIIFQKYSNGLVVRSMVSSDLPIIKIYL